MRCVAITILVLGVSPHVFSQNTPAERAGGAAEILNADDVLAIVNVAASGLGDSTLSVAVVDRTGAILAAYARENAGERGPDYAVSVARAGAMFSHDQAPLSSRTVRFISGKHFPPGVDAWSAASASVATGSSRTTTSRSSAARAFIRRTICVWTTASSSMRRGERRGFRI